MHQHQDIFQYWIAKMGSETKKNQSSLRRKQKTQAALSLSTVNSGAMPTTSTRKESETEEFLTQPLPHLV